MDRIINVAVLGAGNIARSMATALNGMPDKVCFYGIASRSLEKAQQFAKEWKAKNAYGSYEEMAKDENIDLVYIATPHSEHYENTKLCLENGRNCLVEKAFCGNAAQTEKLISLAREKNLLLAEAMWTRYQPAKDIIKSILDSGRLGKLEHMIADFSIAGRGIQRLERPELAGGALLDLGIYPLSTIDMYFGSDFESIHTDCRFNENGMDLNSETEFVYKDGRRAVMKTAFDCDMESNYAIISGTEGSLTFGPTNVPYNYKIFDKSGEPVEAKDFEYLVNGYEYEVLECRDAILEGRKETLSFPLSETLRIMKWMDSIRSRWGMEYPFETKEDRTHPDTEVWGKDDIFR